jgi:hypothetical protein
MVFAIDDQRRRLDGKPVAPSVVVSSQAVKARPGAVPTWRRASRSAYVGEP